MRVKPIWKESRSWMMKLHFLQDWITRVPLRSLLREVEGRTRALRLFPSTKMHSKHWISAQKSPLNKLETSVVHKVRTIMAIAKGKEAAACFRFLRKK